MKKYAHSVLVEYTTSMNFGLQTIYKYPKHCLKRIQRKVLNYVYKVHHNKTSSTHNSNGSCKSHCSISRSSYHIYSLPKNIWDKPPFPLFPMLLMEIDSKQRVLLIKEIIFQHWKRGEGMFHIFRMIYLLKLTVVSIYFVEGCSYSKIMEGIQKRLCFFTFIFTSYISYFWIHPCLYQTQKVYIKNIRNP